MQNRGSSPGAFTFGAGESRSKTYDLQSGSQNASWHGSGADARTRTECAMKEREPQDNAGSPAAPANGRENRSPRTVQTYRKQARPFIEVYCAWRFPPDGCSDPFAELSQDDWADFPAWFAAAYSNAPWCKQTLKLVKISLRYVLRGVLDAKGDAVIRSFRPCTIQEKGTTSLSLHEKNPAPGRILDMLACLDSCRTQLAGLAAAWFRAELVTGLRPKEWEHATYEEDETKGTLTIVNGKQNGMFCQGTGASRKLVFPGPEHEPERIILRDFFIRKEEYYTQLRNDKDYTENKCFSRMLCNCQEKYRMANRRLRRGRPLSMAEKNITLYSLRDAFKADAFNLAGTGPKRRMAIASLMGHSSLFSQDMYAPENMATGRANMPASPETNEQTLSREKTIRQEDTYAGEKEILAEGYDPYTPERSCRR